MELFSIIIDRVGSTNVFNIIQGRLPARETHLQTVVDADLIDEFLAEIEKLSRISNSLSGSERIPIDIPAQMRRVGETFFLQFFPEAIQDRIRSSDQGFLFLHVDHKLRTIPWELLHDGQSFLAERFFMGKNVSGFWRQTNRPERDRLRILIIADPTEDLDWARAEGEALFESLNAELSADRVDVQFMAGRTITKLALLNALKDRDIIHFAGHLYFSEEAKESGWLLADDKVLRAREIEKAGYAPDLVFSNSCFIGPGVTKVDEEKPVSRFNDMAGAFLAAGIYNYIGTNWEIKDSGFTLDFALNFYRAIFEEKSVGEALFEARAQARRNYPPSDLTWANYVLHGNPMTRIFRSGSRQTFDASRNTQTAERIVSRFPFPMARAYADFKAHESGDARTKLLALVQVLEATVKTTAAYVLANFRFLSHRTETRYPPMPLAQWLDRVFETHATMQSAQMELSQSGVIEGLLLHRDNLNKLLSWREALLAKSLSDDVMETYVVTFQYLLENLLADMSPLSRGQFILVDRGGETGYVLHGTKPWVVSMGRGEFREKAIREKIAMHAGKVCFYSNARQTLFSLEGLMEAESRGRIVRFPPMDVEFKELPNLGTPHR